MVIVNKFYDFSVWTAKHVAKFQLDECSFFRVLCASVFQSL
jgi:hypothetical protein